MWGPSPQTCFVILALLNLVLAVRGCGATHPQAQGFDAQIWLYNENESGEAHHSHRMFAYRGYKNHEPITEKFGVGRMNFHKPFITTFNLAFKESIYGVSIRQAGFTIVLSGWFHAETDGAYTFAFRASPLAYFTLGTLKKCSEELSDAEKAVQDVFLTMDSPNEETFTTPLKADQFYPIKIVYIHYEGTASLQGTAHLPTGEIVEDLASVITQIHPIPVRDVVIARLNPQGYKDIREQRKMKRQLRDKQEISDSVEGSITGRAKWNRNSPSLFQDSSASESGEDAKLAAKAKPAIPRDATFVIESSPGSREAIYETLEDVSLKKISSSREPFKGPNDDGFSSNLDEAVRLRAKAKAPEAKQSTRQASGKPTFNEMQKKILGSGMADGFDTIHFPKAVSRSPGDSEAGKNRKATVDAALKSTTLRSETEKKAKDKGGSSGLSGSDSGLSSNRSGRSETGGKSIGSPKSSKLPAKVSPPQAVTTKRKPIGGRAKNFLDLVDLLGSSKNRLPQTKPRHDVSLDMNLKGNGAHKVEGKVPLSNDEVFKWKMKSSTEKRKKPKMGVSETLVSDLNKKVAALHAEFARKHPPNNGLVDIPDNKVEDWLTQVEIDESEIEFVENFWNDPTAFHGKSAKKLDLIQESISSGSGMTEPMDEEDFKTRVMVDENPASLNSQQSGSEDSSLPQHQLHALQQTNSVSNKLLSALALNPWERGADLNMGFRPIDPVPSINQPQSSEIAATEGCFWRDYPESESDLDKEKADASKSTTIGETAQVIKSHAHIPNDPDFIDVTDKVLGTSNRNKQPNLFVNPEHVQENEIYQTLQSNREQNKPNSFSEQASPAIETEQPRKSTSFSSGKKKDPKLDEMLSILDSFLPQDGAKVEPSSSRQPADGFRTAVSNEIEKANEASVPNSVSDLSFTRKEPFTDLLDRFSIPKDELKKDLLNQGRTTQAKPEEDDSIKANKLGTEISQSSHGKTLDPITKEAIEAQKPLSGTVLDGVDGDRRQVLANSIREIEPLVKLADTAQPPRQEESYLKLLMDHHEAFRTLDSSTDTKTEDVTKSPRPKFGMPTIKEGEQNLQSLTTAGSLIEPKAETLVELDDGKEETETVTAGNHFGAEGFGMDGDGPDASKVPITREISEASAPKNEPNIDAPVSELGLPIENESTKPSKTFSSSKSDVESTNSLHTPELIYTIEEFQEPASSEIGQSQPKILTLDPAELPKGKTPGISDKGDIPNSLETTQKLGSASLTKAASPAQKNDLQRTEDKSIAEKPVPSIRKSAKGPVATKRKHVAFALEKTPTPEKEESDLTGIEQLDTMDSNPAMKSPKPKTPPPKPLPRKSYSKEAVDSKLPLKETNHEDDSHPGQPIRVSHKQLKSEGISGEKAEEKHSDERVKNVIRIDDDKNKPIVYATIVHSGAVSSKTKQDKVTPTKKESEHTLIYATLDFSKSPKSQENQKTLSRIGQLVLSKFKKLTAGKKKSDKKLSNSKISRSKSMKNDEVKLKDKIQLLYRTKPEVIEKQDPAVLNHTVDRKPDSYKLPAPSKTAKGSPGFLLNEKAKDLAQGTGTIDSPGEPSAELQYMTAQPSPGSAKQALGEKEVLVNKPKEYKSMKMHASNRAALPSQNEMLSGVKEAAASETSHPSLTSPARPQENVTTMSSKTGDNSGSKSTISESKITQNPQNSESGLEFSKLSSKADKSSAKDFDTTERHPFQSSQKANLPLLKKDPLP